MQRAGLMTIGQMARKSGVSPRAIRYYEQLDLVRPPVRSDSNYRLYDRDSLDRLRFIAKCRALGFSLEEIGELLALTDSSSLSCAQVEALARRHIELVDGKLKDLMEMRTTLAKHVAHCTGQDTPECPIIDYLSKPS